jgi:pyruvate,water dikinase
MSRYIVRLGSKSALQEVCAGGKGASLAWLRRNGFNVPSGFVITSATFADFLANFCIEVLTERRDWTQGDLERIRELLVACRISDHLAHAIGRAYRRLGGRVAIRSSMVGEDTLLTSFAGQLDTILNVRGEREVLEAVKQCWASVFNWRLWNYLTEHEALSSGTLLERFSIAVVVQRMVDAKAAGVAFSADPVTGQRCVVIEAVHGLAEALVQGLAKPDRYVVDARGVLAEAQPAGAPVLEENQILRLAEIKPDPALGRDRVRSCQQDERSARHRMGMGWSQILPSSESSHHLAGGAEGLLQQDGLGYVAGSHQAACVFYKNRGNGSKRFWAHLHRADWPQ